MSFSASLCRYLKLFAVITNPMSRSSPPLRINKCLHLELQLFGVLIYLCSLLNYPLSRNGGIFILFQTVKSNREKFLGRNDAVNSFIAQKLADEALNNEPIIEAHCF
jgi:hypothetical protein